MENFPWVQYYEKTKDSVPNKLLEVAVEYVPHQGDALDLGAGAGRDSIFLAEKGFQVTAVDENPSSVDFFKTIGNEKIKFVPASFLDFEFEEGKYDIISAQNSLMFIQDPEDLKILVGKMLTALKPSGVFTANFSGTNDSWKQTEPVKMTFLEKTEIEEMFKDTEIIKCQEIENDQPTVRGNPHHVHNIFVVARKR